MIKTWTRVLMVVVAAGLFAMPTMADTAKLNEKVKDFTLKNVVTGEEWSLSDNEGKITVLVFQSINCPWDKMRADGGYQRVLTPMANSMKDKNVQFVAINSNKTESNNQVKAYAEKHSIGYPILKDPGAKVADMFGAKTTPHVFVIDEEGVLVYRGGIEKAPSNPGQCGEMKEQYLAPVLMALVADQPLPYTDTKSKGCSIKR